MCKPLWLAIALASSPIVHAADGSSTPYQVLYDVLEPARTVTRFDRLRAIERVTSRLPGVAPHDIRLSIQSRRGAIAVPVADDGRIDFPMQVALREENPDVVTNQPKGSLQLTVAYELVLGNGLRIAWDDLAAAVTQAERAMAGQIGDAHVTGAEFRFGPGSEASITLAGKGERLLMADEAGRAIVMFDEAATREKPALVLSGRPLIVLPYVQP